MPPAPTDRQLADRRFSDRTQVIDAIVQAIGAARLADLNDRTVTPSPRSAHWAIVVRLNANWRVRDDGALQWLLELQHGEPGKAEKWCGRRFHVDRDVLLRSIAELCGPVAPSALAVIIALPKFYCAGAAAKGKESR